VFSIFAEIVVSHRLLSNVPSRQQMQNFQLRIRYYTNELKYLANTSE